MRADPKAHVVKDCPDSRVLLLSRMSLSGVISPKENHKNAEKNYGKIRFLDDVLGFL